MEAPARDEEVPHDPEEASSGAPEYDEEAEEEQLHVDEEEEDDGDPMGEDLASIPDLLGVGAVDGIAAATEINTQSFEELRFAPVMAESIDDAWRAFISSCSSKEAAGEALYGAIYESAPSLQSLFTTPRAVQAMRFMNGLNSFVMSISDPPALKVLVETLGFGHMNMDVTVPRVVLFRDAILDLFQVELGDKFTTLAYSAWKALLNYAGGAMIFIRAHFSERLRILDESWRIANKTTSGQDKFSRSVDDERPEGAQKQAEEAAGSVAVKVMKKKASKKNSKNERSVDDAEGDKKALTQQVPTTFPDMFLFNAAVMGFGTNDWMPEVLACFDNIVCNVANSQRLQEECDVLVLRISRVSTGKVNLSEYKACMLASLRSLLPKDWSTNHEVAWSWLWDNVERLLLKTMGMPPVWEKAYARFYNSLNEQARWDFRAQLYSKFFSAAPSGEDYFKQSNTYLHLIATKVMDMMLEMYRTPVKMTQEISAMGLRHVGYGIPTELFGPFVTSLIEVLMGTCSEPTVVESARWSLGLIAKSLVRTILEGSTIVMKAINLNTKASLNKAIACAPRGERSKWMLVVSVGTESISPLAWSIEGGKLEAAEAILKDLTTFRADRDRYYYGQDELFKRHPDIVKRLCDDAAALLPTLLDGLIWRSRLTFNGQRRVNYYLKHLLVDEDIHFHKTLDWISRLQDPKLVCHPLLVLMTDMIWSNVASWAFFFRKSWFLVTLVIFIISQSVLEHSHFLPPDVEHGSIFACRCFIYLLSMGHLTFRHCSMTVRAYRQGDTSKLWRFTYPNYWENWQDMAGLILLSFLMVMLCTEPILYCMGHEDELVASSGDGSGSGGGSGRLLESSTSSGDSWVLFTEACVQAKDIRKFPYSTFSMLAMFVYYMLLIDLAVFSTRFSSYVLACGRMLSEVGLFLLALLVAVVTFACAFSCLDQKNAEFHGIQKGATALGELALGMFTEEHYEELHSEAVILYGVYTYVIISVVFLINMLIAQLSCSYGSTYLDMIGFARLRRMKLIVETMAVVSEKRWMRFYTNLNLDRKLEFNQGDIGLAGGIQTVEPASANPITVDMIQRFGGSTSPATQWPALDSADEDGDRFERVEKMLQKALQRMSQKGPSGRKVLSARSSGSNREGEASNGSGVSYTSGADQSVAGSDGGDEP